MAGAGPGARGVQSGMGTATSSSGAYCCAPKMSPSPADPLGTSR